MTNLRNLLRSYMRLGTFSGDAWHLVPPDSIPPYPLLDMDTFKFYSADFYTAHLGASATASQSIGTPVIGQYFDQDLGRTTGKMLTSFYESGQMWALLIGVVLGYGFKSFSSYG